VVHVIYTAAAWRETSTLTANERDRRATEANFTRADWFDKGAAQNAAQRALAESGGEYRLMTSRL
jgi:hypothetical protein